MTDTDLEELRARYAAIEARLLDLELRISIAIGSLAKPQPDEPFQVRDAPTSTPR